MDDFDQRPTVQRFADHLLEGMLEEFVRGRRAEGLSWRRIEKQLWTATNGQIDVHGVTLRSWYPDDATAVPETAAADGGGGEPSGQVA